MKLKHLVLVAALGAAPAFASADVRWGIDVRLGSPPPVRVERIPPAPHPGWVWVHGHWGWGHRRWVWIRGYYVAPQPGMVWVEGHWDNTPNGYVWVEGHWAPAAPVAYVAPAPAAVYVQSAPPPLLVEHPGPVPGPEYFWIAGHWTWNGRWVWAPGYYGRHPYFHPGARWVDGHWDHRGRAWVWVGGRWY